MLHLQGQQTLTKNTLYHQLQVSLQEGSGELHEYKCCKQFAHLLSGRFERPPRVFAVRSREWLRVGS